LYCIVVQREQRAPSQVLDCKEVVEVMAGS